MPTWGKKFADWMKIERLTAKPAWKDWGVLVAWMGIIFFMSTDTFSSANTSRFLNPILKAFFPGLTLQQFHRIHYTVRKLGHFAEYAVLAFLWFRTLQVREKNRFWRAALLALTLSVLYAFTDELHQAFIPSRTASLVDVGIDSAGAAFSILGLIIFRMRRPASG